MFFLFFQNKTNSNQCCSELRFALENRSEYLFCFGMVSWRLVVDQGGSQSAVECIFDPMGSQLGVFDYDKDAHFWKEKSVFLPSAEASFSPFRVVSTALSYSSSER